MIDTPTQQQKAAFTLFGFVVLVMVVFLARTTVTFPIEHVDAVFKYAAAAEIVRDNNWEALLRNQHTLRWSEVVPQIIVTRVTGFRYEGLYLLPLLAFSLTFALMVRGMRFSLSISQQALLFAILFLEPLGLQHAGQLLNPPFGVLYTLIALTLLSRKKQTTWAEVLGAAMLFFAAYGAHSTYLSFSAAGFAWLAFVERRPLKAIFLAVALMGLMALEVVWINQLASGNLTLGRFQSLAQTQHVTSMVMSGDPLHVHDLILRWFKLPLFNLILTAGFIICAVRLALDRRFYQEMPDFLKLCVLAGGAYAFSITFAVLDIDPIRPIMPLRNMYLQPFMPFAALCTVYLLADMERGLSRKVQLRLEGGLTVALVLLLAVFISTKTDNLDYLVKYRLNAFFWRANSELENLSQKVRHGEWILMGQNRGAIGKVARYRSPFRLTYDAENRVSFARPVAQDAQCLRTIRKVPIELNASVCKPEIIKATRATNLRIKRESKDRDLK